MTGASSGFSFICGERKQTEIWKNEHGVIDIMTSRRKDENKKNRDVSLPDIFYVNHEARFARV
jgi:hypothetical protein